MPDEQLSETQKLKAHKTIQEKMVENLEKSIQKLEAALIQHQLQEIEFYIKLQEKKYANEIVSNLRDFFNNSQIHFEKAIEDL